MEFVRLFMPKHSPSENECVVLLFPSPRPVNSQSSPSFLLLFDSFSG